MTRHHGLLAVAALLALGACAPSVNPDPRIAHSISVVADTVSLAIVVPGDTAGMTDDDSLRLDGFVQEWTRRGKGPVVAETAPATNDPALSEARVLQVRQLLIDRGIPEGGLKVSAGEPALERTVRLQFRTTRAVVPDCGRFESSMSYNPTNEVPPNFGCATQRNIGLMVSDPSDLVTSPPEEPRTAARTDRAVGNSRSGDAPTSTATPVAIFSGEASSLTGN